jgi:hypothetical protein
MLDLSLSSEKAVTFPDAVREPTVNAPLEGRYDRAVDVVLTLAV